MRPFAGRLSMRRWVCSSPTTSATSCATCGRRMPATPKPARSSTISCATSRRTGPASATKTLGRQASRSAPARSRATASTSSRPGSSEPKCGNAVEVARLPRRPPHPSRPPQRHVGSLHSCGEEGGVSPPTDWRHTLGDVHGVNDPAHQHPSHRPRALGRARGSRPAVPQVVRRQPYGRRPRLIVQPDE